MPELFLTGGRILQITDEESLQIAKCIMLLPDWKQIRVQGVEFRMDEIDYEAQRLSKLPKQEKLNIRVKTVDVEKSQEKPKKVLTIGINCATLIAER